MKVYRELEQGTEEWLQVRCGILTASVIGQLITPTGKVASNDRSRALIHTLTAQRITGYVEEQYVSADMLRGVQDEPFARDAYRENYAPVQEVGFITEQFDGYTLGYSPDGLVGEDGLIEVKSRRQKKHLETIMSGKVPPENMAQIQAGLLVAGRAWCDYISYCAGMPLWTKRVEPEKKWQTVIVDALKQYEQDAALIIQGYEQAVEGLPATERLEVVI